MSAIGGDDGAITTEALMEIVPGPDFPTEGIINGRAGIVEAYRTGRGRIYIRARHEIEHDNKTNRDAIIITELPYQLNKARLIEKLAELLQERKLPLLADVRDESAEDVRIVLEPRARNVDPVILMESLFRLTELESRISLNMNVLVGGLVPRVIGLAEALRANLRRRKAQARARHAGDPAPDGQADVIVYTGDNPLMNALGRIYVRAMSYLSYAY